MDAPEWWDGAPAEYWRRYFAGYWDQILGKSFAPPAVILTSSPASHIQRHSAYQDGWDESMGVALGRRT